MAETEGPDLTRPVDAPGPSSGTRAPDPPWPPGMAGVAGVPGTMGVPPYGMAWNAPPPVASRRRRWWPYWVALGLVVALLCCAAPVALTVAAVRWYPDALPGAATASDEDPRPAPSPQAGDPLTKVAPWLRDRMAEQLDRQAEALLRGDEKGFLAVAEPGSPAVEQLRRQFRGLRALRVRVWQPTASGEASLRDSARREWGLTVTYRHCFAAPDCPVGSVAMETHWVDRGAQPRLIAVQPTTRGGPRPWQVSDLAVLNGERTTVVTTPALRGRLRGLLAEAERAAVVADRYAVRDRPQRYLIYYAGAAEWRRWYGGQLPAWTAGYALPVGGGGYELVINSGAVQASHLDDLLRHELTHAASLPADGYRDDSVWWLVEGLAEYASAGDRMLREYENLSQMRQLLASSHWKGRLDRLDAASDAPDWQIGGAYGIGFLAVRHLIERFGEDRLLEFFRAVVHQRRPLDEASGQVFGVGWTQVHDECVRYVREAVG